MKQTLGGVLKAARIQCGLTLRQLGSQVDAASPHLTNLESGVRQPSLELLSRLARALELEPDKLFLLAHPDEAGAFIRSKPEAERARNKAWRAFIQNKPLLARHKVRPHELKVLGQANQLGHVVAPYDFLFILNSIRQAMDIDEMPDAGS